MTDRRGRPRIGRAVLARPLSSVLFKVLAALLVNLVAAGAVTFVVGTRLTRSALGDQARQVAHSHLRILEEAYGERERTLVANLRNLAQTLHAHGFTEPSRHSALVAELGRARHALDLALLEVVDGRGERLDPPALVGKRLDEAAPGRSAATSFDLTGRLLPTVDGPYVQAVTVPVGAGAYLIGALDFSDAFAYRLRRQLGDLGHVILLAGGEVAGSTIPAGRALDLPPGATATRTPRVLPVGGMESIVAFAAVGHAGPEGQANGALSVALPDPVAPLDRALARARVLATVVLGLVALLLGWLLFRALTRPLVTLAATAGRIAEGDLSASFEGRGDDEVGRLAKCLERMRTELRAQADRLQESSKRIVAAQDEARRAIARDLHDGVQQELVVLRMRLGLAAELATGLPDHVAELVEDLGHELDGTIERVRRASHDLYPSILVDRGLTAALHSYVGRLPVGTRLSSSPDPLPRLAPEIESGAYFLVSEAFTNALKHSEASQIEVSLRLEGGRLLVAVSDDGSGFDPASTPHRSGLLHMEDRVRSFGGELRLASEPGSGTSVVATFPVPFDGADAVVTSPGPLWRGQTPEPAAPQVT